MSMSTRDIQLHLANTEEYYREVIALLHEHRDRYDFAQALREYAQGLVFGDNLTLLQHELLMTAMAHVNWAEIADDYFDEYNNFEP